MPPTGGPAPAADNDLLMAVRGGDAEAAEMSLAQAEEHPLFSIDAADRFGRSLIWYAVTNGHLAIARLLLDRGASVNCRDLVGWMPLHTACFHGRPEVARLLLERGADLDAKTYAGQTPRWLAQSKARPGTGKLSQMHAEIGVLLEELGGSLGLPPQDWVNPRRPRQRRPIPPNEIRCCLEDGERYTISELIKAYVYEKEMYTEEECEDYFRKDMHFPADDHDAWLAAPMALLVPGENKFG